MKRKIVLINLLITFVSLTIFLILLGIILVNNYEKQVEQDLNGYLTIVSNAYNGDNEAEAASTLTVAGKEFRVTFIDLEGNVIYDTELISNENHLLRPEIVHLGEVYHRISSTVEKSYYYIAGFDENTYVRISVLRSSLFNIYSNLVTGGISLIIVIAILTAIISDLYLKKLLKNLKIEVGKLGRIIGNKDISLNEDIDALSSYVDKTNTLITEKIDSLETEKNKLNYVIEHINQGLLIIDSNGKVLIANRYALEILEYYSNDYMSKSYIYLLHNFNITEDIERAIHQNINLVKELSIGDKYYQVNIISLEKSFASYDNLNGVSIFILDVTERKRLEQMKTDFFQNASHELKSPLTTILGYQQLIDQKIINDEQGIEEATKSTITEAKRINNILADMLDLFKLESKIEGTKEILSIKHIIKSILDSLKPYIDAKHIQISIPDNDLKVIINSEDLTRLCRNLIDNGIKYNKENGKLFIGLEQTKLIISDTGIGIPQKYLDRIFERFFRVDKGRSRSIGGTGLGLAIVKHICINNDIEISVASEENVGTTFVLELKNVVIK